MFDMSFIDVFFIALAVSMDAFSVAICKGLSTSKINYKHALITGLFFGLFQALMPFIGYVLGTQFKDYITVLIPFVALILLSIIGIKMIKESFNECEQIDNRFDLKTMLMLSVATSIDALAVGITFACLQVQIVRAINLIGITTFTFSFIGVLIGNVLGAKFKNKAELFGGIVLILIGLKIFIENIGIFN